VRSYRSTHRFENWCKPYNRHRTTHRSINLRRSAPNHTPHRRYTVVREKFGERSCPPGNTIRPRNPMKGCNIRRSVGTSFRYMLQSSHSRQMYYKPVNRLILSRYSQRDNPLLGCHTQFQSCCYTPKVQRQTMWPARLFSRPSFRSYPIAMIPSVPIKNRRSD